MTDDPFWCRCVLCHDYGDRREADRMDLTVIEHVQQYGWHVVMVPEDEIGPGFAYTIGLAHTHGGPELAMFGEFWHNFCGVLTGGHRGSPLLPNLVGGRTAPSARLMRDAAAGE